MTANGLAYPTERRVAALYVVCSVVIWLCVLRYHRVQRY